MMGHLKAGEVFKMSELVNLLSYTFMQRALLCGIAISFSAALIGVILTLKNYSMIGHGLGLSCLFVSLIGYADILS